MVSMFEDIKGALERGDTLLCLLQGVAGSGKSTFVTFLMAYVRSIGLIAKGCASTGLAATVYDDFTTAHNLFAIPVQDDEEDYDQEGDFSCNLKMAKYQERREVLKATSFFAWDEVSSQNMRDIRAVFEDDVIDGFKGKVLLLCGDALQITPVVKGGNKSAICASSIYCSEYMGKLKVYTFTKTLRFTDNSGGGSQLLYSKFVKCISINTIPDLEEGQPFSIACDAQQSAGVKRLYIPKITTLMDERAVLDFCFKDGFRTESKHKSCILAATNVQVDKWNKEVQALNPNKPAHELMSKDSVDLCDDPHGYLKAMVTEDVMNRYEDAGSAPPHLLTLKVNDVAILMRSVDKKVKLATNTRVRIIGISPLIVRVCTLDGKICANLPRFLFSIKLPYGKSFEMTRRQFPLRLAYSLSINRSQGQTFDGRVVVDLTKHCFMHGHLNVALSRIRDCKNIAVHVLDTDVDVMNEMFITSNVVYPEILKALGDMAI